MSKKKKKKKQDTDSGESGEAGEADDAEAEESPAEQESETIVTEVETVEINGLLMLEAEAQEMLDVFRGTAGFARPADVTVRVSQGSASPVDVADAVDNLRLRGFDVVNSGDVSPDSPTTVTFGPELGDHAELLARFLKKLPAASLTSTAGEPIDLVVGSDYAGIGFLPRPEAEVEAVLAAAKLPSQQSSPSSTIESVGSGTSVPETTIPPAATTTAPNEAVDETATPTSTSTTTIVVQGKVPAGTACS